MVFFAGTRSDETEFEGGKIERELDCPLANISFSRVIHFISLAFISLHELLGELHVKLGEIKIYDPSKFRDEIGQFRLICS